MQAWTCCSDVWDASIANDIHTGTLPAGTAVGAGSALRLVVGTKPVCDLVAQMHGMQLQSFQPRMMYIIQAMPDGW